MLTPIAANTMANSWSSASPSCARAAPQRARPARRAPAPGPGRGRPRGRAPGARPGARPPPRASARAGGGRVRVRGIARHQVGLRLQLLDEAGLPADLRGDVVVRQARGGEERDLLATRDGVHGVNGRDTGLDHLLRVRALGRVDGRAVDVQERLRQHRRPARRAAASEQRRRSAALLGACQVCQVMRTGVCAWGQAPWGLGKRGALTRRRWACRSR